jgi:isopentenyldiphosphate isomerase
MTELVIVVDDNDTVLRFQDRSTLDHAKDRWRNTAIILTNEKGDILLAKRNHLKKTHPNMWAASASGTVESHESYEECAYKELFEELGLSTVELRHIGTYRMNLGSEQRFCGIFTGIFLGGLDDIHIQKSEVAEVKWFTRIELKTLFNTTPAMFAPGFTDIIKLSGALV